MRRSVSSTNSSPSSPSTNTAVEPRKCTPTTGAPAITWRVRSASDGIWAGVSLTSGDAAFEALPDLVFRQIAADEDDTAVALLVGAPRALVIAIKDHVHTLKHKTLGVVLERQYPLAAQDIRTVRGDEILNPGKELVGIERLVGLD